MTFKEYTPTSFLKLRRFRWALLTTEVLIDVKIADKFWKWPIYPYCLPRKNDFFESKNFDKPYCLWIFEKIFWTVPYFIHIIMVLIPLFLEENNLFYPDKLKSVSLSVHYLYLIRFRPILFFSVLFQVLYSLWLKYIRVLSTR